MGVPSEEPAARRLPSRDREVLTKKVDARRRGWE